MTPTRSEAIAAAKVLRQWCESNECAVCFLNGKHCNIGNFHIPADWDVPETESEKT